MMPSMRHPALRSTPATASEIATGTHVLTSRQEVVTMRVRLVALVAIVLCLGASCGAVAAARAPQSQSPFGPTTRGVESDGSLDLGCPSADEGDGTRFRIKVVKWCGLVGARHQWQLKLQIKITNIGKNPLDVSLRHIALVMTHFNLRGWSSPRHSAYAASRPYQSTYEGRRVWIVPANPERAYDDLPSPPGNRTFATHWNVSFSLAPGKTFTPVDHVKGAAVFYVPRYRSTTKLSGVLGVAYVTGPHISVVCPPERWGPNVGASDF
jgi:hypothetical protein